MTSIPRRGSSFRDLALALTEEERRSLLKRIAAGLNLRAVADEPRYRSAVADDRRADVIAREIRSMGFWRRLRFAVRRLFGTRSDEHTYVEFRLCELRRRARSVCPALRPIVPHSIGSAIADHTFGMYRVVYAVIPLFRDLWRGSSYLEEAIAHLLAQRIPSARSELPDFVTIEELQEVFIRRELKSEVRELVVSRLDTYLAEIPDELFDRLEEGLLPFYFLKPISLFDYRGFFSAFGFDPGMSRPQETPPFRNAPTSTALPVVENLYSALRSAGRLESGFSLHTEILDRYLEMKEREETAPNATDEATEQAHRHRRAYVEQLRDQIHALHAAACMLSRTTPLADLIRYHARNPWLRIKWHVPKLELREFYRSYLMISVLGRLDEVFPEVRRGVVERMMTELFGGDIPSLMYFRAGVQLTPVTGGFASFVHLRSLAAAYAFLRSQYCGRMQECLRILSRILPVRQRDSSSELITHVSGVEEALADIEHFDVGFSPDSDDGKAYYRIRYAVEKDATMLRSYRNIVQQRDREAALLVDRATEHLVGLAAVFDAIQRTLTDQIRERYASADGRVNPIDGIDRLVAEQRRKLDQFIRLIRQIRAMEEGY